MKKINLQHALNYSALLETLSFSTKSFFEKYAQLKKFIFSEDPILRNLKELSLIVESEESHLAEVYRSTFLKFKKVEFSYAIISIGDDRYPQIMREMFHPLPFYFAKGDVDLLKRRAISIVGTRHPSEEGRLRAKKLAMLAADMGFVIVSGLARGIDTAAHQGAISVGGNTIAVIGTPLDQYYPKENEPLQDIIAESNLLLSQFPFNQPVMKYNFPARNNTMAGLTLATVIIEAGETSGALIQARYALQQGRKLFILDNVLKDDRLTWPKIYLKKGAIPIARIEDLVVPLKEFFPKLQSKEKESSMELFNQHKADYVS